MSENTYVFRKTHEVDKDKFAQLLLAAKGGRTMKDFAESCDVNPSTLTRIVQKTNKGASSTELLKAIAENAVHESGVTLESLADANGYTLVYNNGTTLTLHRINNRLNEERHIREVLVQELLDRGQQVSLGNIRYKFSKNLELRPDLLIMTEAFSNKNEVWFVEVMPNTARFVESNMGLSRLRHRTYERISHFVFVSMNKVERFRPSRFSIVVTDKAVFDAIVEEFAETVVPTDISIIFVDIINSTIIDEVMLPHITKGKQESYFMTTPTISEEETNYVDLEEYDEE